MVFSLQVHKPNMKNSSSNQPCLEPLKFPIPHQTTRNKSWPISEFTAPSAWTKMKAWNLVSVMCQVNDFSHRPSKVIWERRNTPTIWDDF